MSQKIYRPHQKIMAEYFSKSTHPALLVEMRLGKTLVTIRETVKKGYRLIAIVAPINGMVAWKRQLEEEQEEFIEAYGMSSDLRAQRVMEAINRSTRVWVLINYEGFRFLPELLEIPWDSVILDESVKIKNPQSKISKALTTSFTDVPGKAILTGNIAPENLLEIFPQFKFLHGRFMGKSNFWNWRSEYFEPSYDGFSWQPKPGNKKHIIDLMHKKSCVIRRKDVGMDKSKYYTIRTVSMSPKQRKLYAQVEKEFLYELNGVMVDETCWATEKALWLTRIASGFTPDCSEVLSTAKIEEILYLLQNELVGESVVIWYRYRATLLHDLKFLKAAGIKCSHLIGNSGKDGEKLSVAEAEKEELRFMKKHTQVMLCMERLGAYAKDFSVASTAIYRENEVSWDLRSQSEDRILDIGKMGGLSIIDIVTDDTIDLSISEALQNKKYDSGLVMSNALKKLTLNLKKK